MTSLSDTYPAESTVRAGVPSLMLLGDPVGVSVCCDHEQMGDALYLRGCYTIHSARTMSPLAKSVTHMLKNDVALIGAVYFLLIIFGIARHTKVKTTLRPHVLCNFYKYLQPYSSVGNSQ